MASQGLPPSTVASTAISATYGGVLLAEPMPTGWKLCRYSCHSPDTPPNAGLSAPPVSVPAVISRRSAATVITVSAANSSTPGLVRIRCANPVSVSRYSSSSGSSVAWWLPAVSIWVEV